MRSRFHTHKKIEMKSKLSFFFEVGKHRDCVNCCHDEGMMILVSWFRTKKNSVVVLLTLYSFQYFFLFRFLPNKTTLLYFRYCCLKLDFLHRMYCEVKIEYHRFQFIDSKSLGTRTRLKCLKCSHLKNIYISHTLIDLVSYAVLSTQNQSHFFYFI